MSLLERDDQLLGLEAALEAARQVGSRRVPHGTAVQCR
jgi:hypothetical protein